MNRKLHNTVMALIASSSLFVLGLLTATPVLPGLAPAPTNSAAVFDADEAVAAEAPAASAQGDADAPPRRHVHRASRQSLAMPFFSFAPRG